MNRTAVTGALLALSALLAAANAARAEEGRVTLPLATWERMQQQIEREAEPPRPDIAFCPMERRLTGAFRKGLFSGRLTARFEVLAAHGHVRVPVLDAGASLGEVALDGRQTSLLRQGGMYTLGVDEPGTHTVEVEFFWGREQVDFARRLSFRLPEAGPTRVELHIPEQDIEAELRNGALVERGAIDGGTRLVGQLDATGRFDVSWKRKLSHREAEAVRLEAQLYSLFTVQLNLVAGLAVFDLKVIEGETDRIDLRLPEGIEVTEVEGDAVLQWHTDPGGGGRLTVLLRYLVADHARLAVRFQFPAREGEPVALRMPLPLAGVEMSGALGVLGPAGLKLEVAGAEGAQQLPARDLPPELTDLSASPLQYGFRFEQAPAIQVRATRHAEVELTSTLIDELQASSVVLEDGTETTKLKLRIRNHTAQYLALELPDGAALTHSLVDGQPVRPAQDPNDQGALLFPLRQSERITGDQGRVHQVRPGETLSELANFYYSDPNRWRLILENNPDQLADEFDITTGQRLRIPAKGGVKIEESSFVIELAYKNRHATAGSMGLFGWRELRLPAIRRVEVMKAVWHLYLPQTFEPLDFEANLVQYSAIRYDPFRRLRTFLSRLLWTRAWAGAKYESILVQRKAIYKADTERRGAGEAVLATFPLVGQRYRFERNLLGTETPRIGFSYCAGWVTSAMRWLAFLGALGLTLLVLGRARSWRRWLIAGAGLVLLLIIGHTFLGVHRRILWGIDLALLWSVLRLRWGPFWHGLKDMLWSPWRVVHLLTWRNLAFVIGLVAVLGFVLLFPMLLSTTALVVLALWYRRKARLAAAAGEVAHV